MTHLGRGTHKFNQAMIEYYLSPSVRENHNDQS